LSKIKIKSKKRNIKSSKIDKRKRKMLVFKCTITEWGRWSGRHPVRER